jgi:hypothetical protein
MVASHSGAGIVKPQLLSSWHRLDAKAEIKGAVEQRKPQQHNSLRRNDFLPREGALQFSGIRYRRPIIGNLVFSIGDLGLPSWLRTASRLRGNDVTCSAWTQMPTEFVATRAMPGHH